MSDAWMDFTTTVRDRLTAIFLKLSFWCYGPADQDGWYGECTKLKVAADIAQTGRRIASQVSSTSAE